ncbi:MAG: histidine kinase N-terminal 7TM domain-containing protein, partial [Promethearchaeota archaeon]
MELSLLSIFGIALSSTCFVLGIVVFNSGKQKIHKIWTLFNLCICIWGLGMFFIGNKNSSVESSLFWWKFAHIGGMFIPVVFFHTILELSSRRKRKTLLLFYLQAAFFVTLILFNRIGWELEYMFNSFYYIKSISYPYIFVTIFWLIPMSWGFIILINTLRHSQGIQRHQLKYFSLGTIIGFIGGASHFLPVYGIKIYPFNITIVFYVLIATYAILRYRLMDINLVIKRTAVYSLSAGLLSGIFVVFVLSMTRLISNFADVSSFKISILAAVLIALTFDP